MVKTIYEKALVLFFVFFLCFVFTCHADLQQKQNYIVRFKDSSLANQFRRSEKRLKQKSYLKSRSAHTYRLLLAERRETFCRSIEKKIKRPLKIIKSFDVFFNAVAVSLSYKEAEEISKLPDIMAVKKEKTYKLLTDAGPGWIEADKVWASSALSSKGEGLVIGIIDTGINPANPSFADEGGDGYDHTNPKGQYFGVCDSSRDDYDPDFSCNDKLIGAYDFTPLRENPYNTETPYDVYGHGSHVAGTAAGNFIDDAEYNGLILSISGVAPHANIISYRACYRESQDHPEWNGCPEISVLAAIEQAMLDGVDIINFSIGGSYEDPWEAGTFDAQAFLSARDLGIFVSVSAGNDGPDSETINSPANAPWVLSVGNVSHNRVFNNGLIINDESGDIIYPSSSRGPNPPAPNILKPDVMAPGTNILAAYGTENRVSWETATGTSMSAPHAAGAAALVKALQPDWTPAEIQSALMMSSVIPSLKADSGDDFVVPGPFDTGSGRIDVSKAVKAGFVLNETYEKYLNADPKTGNDPSSLNLASLTKANAVVSHSWTRTFRSTMNTNITWSAELENPEGVMLSVVPASFVLSPGTVQTVTITADVSEAVFKTWLFGSVFFTTTSSETVSAAFPVAIKRSVSNLNNMIVFNDVKEYDNDTILNIEPGVDITSLNLEGRGLYPAEIFKRFFYQDPTPDNIFDTSVFGTPEEGTFIITKMIKAGTKRLVAEIIDTTAYDLDLFILKVPNIIPVCSAATSTVYEYCNIENPAPGTYWIAVQNWLASSSETADSVSIAVAEVKDEDRENMTFSSADNKTEFIAGEFFDLEVGWDLCGKTDHWYGAFSVGSDNESLSNIGSAQIDIHLESRDNETFSLFLNRGWNLISFPLYPSDTDIEAVLDSISGKYTKVWTFKDKKVFLHVPFLPGFDSLETMEPGIGYYIKMKEAAVLDIAGIKNLCPIELNKGWNLTGFNWLAELDISDALFSITDKVRAVWSYNGFRCLRYSPEDPDFSMFSTMEPGRGYWVFATEESVWEVK